MTRYPSVKTLDELTRKEGGRELSIKVRRVLDGRDTECDEAWEHRFTPRWMRKLTAVDALIHTHGVEHVDYECCREDVMNCQEPPFRGFSYCNAGDTYNATLVYDEDRGTFRVTSWGDMVEAYERRCAKCRRLADQ